MNRYEAFLSYYKLYDDCFILRGLLFGKDDKELLRGFTREHEYFFVANASLDDKRFEACLATKRMDLMASFAKDVQRFLDSGFSLLHQLTCMSDPVVRSAVEGVYKAIEEAANGTPLDTHALIGYIDTVENSVDRFVSYNAG